MNPVLGAAAAAWLAAAAVSVLPASQTYAGRWDFYGDSDGASACVVELKTPTVIGGYAIAVPKACHAVFRAAGDIYAWHPAPGGRIVFADATRKAMLVFDLFDDVYVARTPDGAGYVLSRVRPAKPRKR